MATAIDTKEWSDEFNDAKCSICAKENKDKIAHYYCYDCKKHMCTSCIGTHNKFIENHNAVTLYCRQHDELLCRKCHLMDHSKQVTQVRLREDNSACDIYGFCHLSDGSLMIADYNNRRLKRVDPSSGHITTNCDLDGQPRDVCCIGPNQLAVAFGSSQVHVYCAVCLTRTRTIDLGHNTYNTCKIACHGGRLYCGATSLLWSRNMVFVHDVSDFRLLKALPVEYCDWDQEYHDIISGIAVNGSGDRVYVTGWGGLICENTYGRQLFRLSQKDLGLSRASGVTTDNHGHVFVCGGVSNNVVKLTEDGDVVGEILSWRDGIERPRCLKYDMIRRRLCVVGESDDILIFELE